MLADRWHWTPEQVDAQDPHTVLRMLTFATLRDELAERLHATNTPTSAPSRWGDEWDS